MSRGSSHRKQTPPSCCGSLPPSAVKWFSVRLSQTHVSLTAQQHTGEAVPFILDIWLTLGSELWSACASSAGPTPELDISVYKQLQTWILMKFSALLEGLGSSRRFCMCGFVFHKSFLLSTCWFLSSLGLFLLTSAVPTQTSASRLPPMVSLSCLVASSWTTVQL